MVVVQILHGAVQVSKEDVSWATSRPWHVGDTGYAMGYSGIPGGTPQRMHRVLMERVLGRQLAHTEFVDHINGDKLDNRRENLRVATKSQNGMNRRFKTAGTSSKFFGVARHRADGGWMTYVNVSGKRIYCGNYKDEEEAAWMRDQFAMELHGDFVGLNFTYEPVEANA